MTLFCPKCGSSDVQAYAERSHWTKNSKGETVFHCRSCGKILYGAAADAELVKQAAAPPALKRISTEAPTPDPRVLRRHAVALGQTRMADLKRMALQILPEAEELLRQTVNLFSGVDPSSPRIEELKGHLNLVRIEVGRIRMIATANGEITLSTMETWWRESTLQRVRDRYGKAQELSKGMTPALAEIIPFEKCGWKDCSNPRRPTSIYCSTGCKNRNAHWREAERKALKSGRPSAGFLCQT